MFIAHVELINQKLVKLNVSNVQILLVELESPSELERDQRLNVKNAAHLENTWITRLVSVAHAVMDSSNQTKDHSHAIFVASDKQREQLKQNRELNVATNVLQACNWVLMENVSHVHEALIDHKEFNQLVKHVRSEELLQRLAHRRLKNVHFQFVLLVHTLIPQLMSVLNVAKDTINQNLNNLLAYHAHQITAQRTLPPHQRLNVQILAKVPAQRLINIVTSMHIVSSYQRPLTLNANASLALMELEFNAQVR